MDEWHSGFETKCYVTDPLELFGYEEPEGVLEQLCRTLSSGTSIQVIGDRNAGKTSVLRCVETCFSMKQRHHLPVYLEFHGTGVRNALDAYRHIVAQVHGCFLARSNRPESLTYGRVCVSADLAPASLYDALKTLDEYEILNGVEPYFKQLNKCGFGVLLLFDEYEYLMRTVLQGQEEKLWRLRNVAELTSRPGSPRPLTVVLAGALEWDTFRGPDGSPLWNFVSSLRILSPLTREAFGRMWTHCREQCGPRVRQCLDAASVDVDRVYDLAGGWAFAGKAIGQHMIACKAINEEQLACDFHPHFKVLWEQRTGPECEQLLAVARGDAVPIDAMSDLRRRGLVEDGGNGVAQLRGTLWRQWVTARLHPASASLVGMNPPAYLFHREGNCYRVCFAGRDASFPRTKGFDYVADLLSRPDPPNSIGARQLEVASGTRRGLAGTEEGDAELSEDSVSLQEGSDREALQAYKHQLEIIRADLDRIAKNGETHPGEQQQLIDERAQICDHVKQDSGLRGRARNLDSSPETKAYDRVRKALNKTYETVETELLELARHLRDSISTESKSFAYRPCTPIKWQF